MYTQSSKSLSAIVWLLLRLSGLSTTLEAGKFNVLTEEAGLFVGNPNMLRKSTSSISI